ncbi:MAG: Glycosyl transferase family 2 [Parcubacteria group bacterium GW2011_GWA2_47_12]|nr:MAG: Glycosyl transferase family 2 [Parcubacteria group bacterium GW2011_GWA2_47_12]
METKNKPDLSIVIPLYNEERRLSKTFEAIRRFAAVPDVLDFEVVFVDDGSSDGSALLVRDFIHGFKRVHLISHKKNRGKGAAVRTGMLVARGKWRLFMDADMATDLTEFIKFVPSLNAGAQVCIGNRRMAGAEVLVRQPWLREAMGGAYTALANFFTGAGVSDFTCGFKCFSAEAAVEIFSRSVIARWSYDAEILFLAHRLGYAIKEVPVVWKNNGATRVRLWKDTPRAFFDLFRIRIHALLGRYRSIPQQ